MWISQVVAEDFVLLVNRTAVKVIAKKYLHLRRSPHCTQSIVCSAYKPLPQPSGGAAIPHSLQRKPFPATGSSRQSRHAEVSAGALPCTHLINVHQPNFSSIPDMPRSPERYPEGHVPQPARIQQGFLSRNSAQASVSA